MQIKLYTRQGCTLCEYAKTELRKKNLQFTEIPIDDQAKRDEVKRRYPDAKMLPIVIVDGTWIGGRDELVKYLNK